MVKRIIVEKSSYYDSIFLMLMNREIRKITGVKDAAVIMGGERNIELLKEIGFSTPVIDSTTPNDLVIAVETVDERTAQIAVQSAKDLIK
jgi:FdrA protein